MPYIVNINSNQQQFNFSKIIKFMYYYGQTMNGGNTGQQNSSRIQEQQPKKKKH